MAGKTTNAGFLFNETDTTGANFVSLPQSPSIITLFIDITATASLTIALRDSEKTGFIPVRTITSDAIVKISLPATQLQVSVTANTGLVTVTYRINVTENFPDQAIEVFTGGTIEPGTSIVQLDEPVTIDGTITVNSGATGVVRKVLGQSNPSAATLTTGYTVPANTTAELTVITITNRSATPTAFRLAIRIGGAGASDEQYIAYDEAIGANETIERIAIRPLATGDIVSVYATLATLSFNIFGFEYPDA